MNSFQGIRFLARAIGPANALKILGARLNNSRLISIDTPFGRLNVRPDSSDPLMASDVLWQREYSFDYPKDPRLIVDAGANIGCSTRYYLSQFERTTIVAIEPDPANYEVLRANCHRAKRAVLLNKALWPEKGSLKLDYSLKAECAVRTMPLDNSSDSKKLPIGYCETVTPFDLVRNFGHIDILKIDIEGAEANLFSPESDLSWLNSVSCIVIELHDRYEHGCSRNFWRAVHEFTREACNGENFFVSRQ